MYQTNIGYHVPQVTYIPRPTYVLLKTGVDYQGEY